MTRVALIPRHFTDEEIERANRVGLVELAQRYGFKLENGGRKALHAKDSGGLYIFKDNNRFYHWTSDTKGGAIDFVMKFDNKTFAEAVEQLIGKSYEPYIRDRTAYMKEERGPLVLSEKAQNFKRAYWYLVSVRGIEPEVISLLMNEKKIYQEAKYGNCVFVGYDRDNNPKYCAMRSSSEKSSFKMDAVNSDKSYPFYYEGKSDTVIVSESPIDLMSHATLSRMYGQDWKQDHRLSLGCTWDGALERYLKDHHEIRKIVFALDNDFNARDKDGKRAPNYGQMAAEKYCKNYGEKGYSCAIHRPHLKDFNQDLVEVRKGKKPEELDAMRESILEGEFEKDVVEDPPDEQEEELER